MKIKDSLLTIVVSVVTTLVVTRWLDRPSGDRVHAAEQEAIRELTVDRLIVHNELIVSDTGKPWDDGFEEHQIPRGMVVRSLGRGPNGENQAAGIWVRGRLIKTEIDDPFDDRFHAINRDGSIFKAPGHMSWNVWIDGAWRQIAIIQGEGMEFSEIPRTEWTGGNHPGRIRFQSFRPNHNEPLTDVMMGQGMMSVGGGGYGGGGLPYPSKVLQLWGGEMQARPVDVPSAPRLLSDDASGEHTYALIAVAPDGTRSALSKSTAANGLAELEWNSATGADAYIIVRDGQELPGLLRIEGSNKHWTDKP